MGDHLHRPHVWPNANTSACRRACGRAPDIGAGSLEAFRWTAVVHQVALGGPSATSSKSNRLKVPAGLTRIFSQLGSPCVSTQSISSGGPLSLTAASSPLWCECSSGGQAAVPQPLLHGVGQGPAASPCGAPSRLSLRAIGRRFCFGPGTAVQRRAGGKCRAATPTRWHTPPSAGPARSFRPRQTE